MRLKRVGVTTDGKPCLDFFEACDAEGVPLAVALEFAAQHGVAFAWSSFIRRARACGWNIARKLPEWRCAVSDVHGPEYAKEWEKRAAMTAQP